MVESTTDLGRMLRAARDAKGMSRKALAEQIGRTEMTVLNVELGRVEPTVLTIYRICKVLEADLIEAIEAYTRDLDKNHEAPSRANS